MHNRNVNSWHRWNDVTQAQIGAGLAREIRRCLGKSWRIGINKSERASDQSFVKDTITGANRRSTVAPGIPDQPDTRAEVIQIVVIPATGAHHGQVRDLTEPVDPGRLVQGALQAVPLKRNAVELVSQAEVERQVAPQFPVVLEEGVIFMSPVVSNQPGSGGIIPVQIAIESLLNRRDAPEQVVIERSERGGGGRSGGTDAIRWIVAVVRVEKNVGINPLRAITRREK